MENTVTKEQAKAAKALLQKFERQENRRKRAEKCALPCSALVSAYLQEVCGCKFADLPAREKKLYRSVFRIEQNQRNRRAKGQVELSDLPKMKRHRWNAAMYDALQKSDLAFLYSCGLTDAAINSMRNKILRKNKN